MPRSARSLGLLSSPLLICLLVWGRAGCPAQSTSIGVPDAGPDAELPEPDAGGADADAEPPPVVQHARCTMPGPDPLPHVPSSNVDATGRPLFDEWRDISCDSDDLAVVCSDDAHCEFGGCFPLELGGRGVCTGWDIDIWCDGEGEVIGFRDGDCWTCMPVAAHAAACCAGLSGVDCRAWPFPADGAPGMVCARHEDCEPGLVCGPHRGEGYGICQCPEVYGSDLSPGDGCWPYD